MKISLSAYLDNYSGEESKYFIFPVYEVQTTGDFLKITVIDNKSGLFDLYYFLGKFSR